MGLSPEKVAGVSAGAGMAAILLADRVDRAMEFMLEATAANQKNFYPENLFSADPLFPHARIFRRAMMEVFDPLAIKRLKDGPEFNILLAVPPPWAGPRLSLLLGFGCYTIEKWISKPVHPELSVKAGFRPMVVDARGCSGAEELTNLIMSSSCTPPFTPIMTWEGKTVLDGGLVDNIPVQALGPDPGRTLVLATRPYSPSRLLFSADRLYVQPSETIGIYKWDYTSPEGLQAAFDLGKSDGKKFAAQYEAVGPEGLLEEYQTTQMRAS